MRAGTDNDTRKATNGNEEHTAVCRGRPAHRRGAAADPGEEREGRNPQSRQRGKGRQGRRSSEAGDAARRAEVSRAAAARVSTSGNPASSRSSSLGPSMKRRLPRVGQARGQGRADHRRRLGIGRAVAVLYAREGARRGDRLPRRGSGRRGDSAGGRGRRARAASSSRATSATPSSAATPSSRRVERVRPARHPGEQRRVSGERGLHRGDQRRAVGPDIPNQHLRLLLHGTRGAAAPEAGQRRSSIPGRSPAIEGSSHLLDYSATKGAIHTFTKSLAQSVLDRGHPGELRGARAGLDPAQSRPMPSPRGCRSSAARYPMARPGAAGGGRTGLRVSRVAVDSSYITGEVLPILGGETDWCVAC